MVKLLAKGMNYMMGRMLDKRRVVISSTLEFMQRQPDTSGRSFDYFRLATLELASHEINRKKLNGHVAELGVFQGKFARFINRYFPDRKLFLFDTFEGFDKRDVEREKSGRFSSGEQDFSNTSVQQVLSIMPHPDQCIPVKGYFPESATGLDEQFVFVSIDTDLYEPVYNGLQYFFPRLARGGYIFVHDFNNDAYPGARNAVERFCNESGIGFLPIPDAGGSVVIAK